MTKKENSSIDTVENNNTYFLKFYIFIIMYVITALFIIYFAFKIDFKPVNSMFFNTEITTNSSSELNVNTDKRTIIIDAGHGGIDGGAVGIDDIIEKDLNLKVALKIEKLFKLSDVEVILTRDEDELLNDENAKKMKASDLSNRVKIAKNNPNAIFLSIHMNKFPQEKYYGLQVFYSPNNIESAKLALQIQEYNTIYLQPEISREVKRGKDIYVLENVNNCAVLVECGFISNRQEAERLSSDEYQNKLSFMIFNAVLEYINNSEDTTQQ